MAAEKASIERRNAHLRAKNLFHSGNVQEALVSLESALRAHGSHVGLLADIAFCQFQIGNFPVWRHFNEVLVSEYEKCSTSLCPSSRARTLICLGKFKENEGYVGQAFRHYREALEVAEVPDEAHWIALAQVVRVSAHYGIETSELAGRYRELMSPGSFEFQNGFDLEIEHSLLHAELYLFGNSLAAQRLSRIQSNTGASDFNLCLFDLIEWHLLRGHLWGGELNHKLRAAETSNPFEISLRKFALGEIVEVDELFHAAKEMPFASFLRLLILLLKNEGMKPVMAFAIERRLAFLLGTLPKEDRVPWLERKSGSDSPTKISSRKELIIDASARTVSLGGFKLPMGRSRSSFDLLKLLSASPSMSLEETTEKLWGCPYNWSHYNRLRVLTQRLNELLSTQFGLEHVICFSKEGISLDPRVGIS